MIAATLLSVPSAEVALILGAIRYGKSVGAREASKEADRRNQVEWDAEIERLKEQVVALEARLTTPPSRRRKRSA